MLAFQLVEKLRRRLMPTRLQVIHRIVVERFHRSIGKILLLVAFRLTRQINRIAGNYLKSNRPDDDPFSKHFHMFTLYRHRSTIGRISKLFKVPLFTRKYIAFGILNAYS